MASPGPQRTSDEATQPASNSADQSLLDISRVAIGTPRDVALSGLANNYKLTKEDIGGGQIEVWLVEKKAASGPTDFWEIAFKDGKLASVITHLSPTLRGDAVGLAPATVSQELYPRAEAESGQVAKFLGSREITVEVELGQMTTATGNEETMRLDLPNGTTFEIRIRGSGYLGTNGEHKQFQNELTGSKWRLGLRRRGRSYISRANLPKSTMDRLLAAAIR